MKTKAKQIKERVQNILSGKAGMTMVEILILISVILVIATALFLMRGKITGFLGTATNQIGTLDTGGTIGNGGTGLPAAPAE